MKHKAVENVEFLVKQKEELEDSNLHLCKYNEKLLTRVKELEMSLQDYEIDKQTIEFIYTMLTELILELGGSINIQDYNNPYVCFDPTLKAHPIEVVSLRLDRRYTIPMLTKFAVKLSKLNHEMLKANNRRNG